MKKIAFVTTLVFLVLNSATISAQEKKNKYEVGLGFDYYLDMEEDVSVSPPCGLATFFEWRRTNGRHWDYGVRADTKFALATWYHFKGSVTYLGLLAVTDFNMLPGKKVNPYIGIAAGPALGLFNVGYSTAYFVVSACPRVGVELFNHLRVSIEADISITSLVGHQMESGGLYSPCCLNIGWTF